MPYTPRFIREGICVRAADLCPAARVEWVDYAKGFWIVFVVMMHSTLGI